MNDLPYLGAGLGYRAPLRSEIFINRQEIDFLEITTDHFLNLSPRKLQELEMLKQHFTVIPHCLDLSLGSAEGLDEQYLDKVAEIVEFLDPPWFSDHISFTRAGGVNIGHLAPLPFTEEALRTLTRNIEGLRKRIRTPLILENITYNLQFPFSEMSEPQFISRLVEETGCGLLLDVTNLYINSKNLGYCVSDYLDAIPASHVVQVHFVGSHVSGERLVDAHADSTQQEIWNVFEEVCVRCDIKGAILERDGNFPPFSELLKEVGGARRRLMGICSAQAAARKTELSKNSAGLAA